MKKFFLYAAFIFIHAIVFANTAHSDQRIKIIPYQKNGVVSMTGTHFVSTQIILGMDEQIVDIQGGDADAWTVNVDKTFPNTFNLKPTLSGSHTNLTVVTTDKVGERRNYYFELRSVERSESSSDQTYAIVFEYPNQSADNAKKTPKIVSPVQYHSTYRFHGDRSLMPKRIFDDGRFTYFEFQTNQPVPAVFAVLNARGDEAVVNFRQEGDRLIVLQTAPQFTLRLGHRTASIFNDDAIAQLRRFL